MEDKPELLSDEQLINSIASGDQVAFAELVRRYLSGLVKFSARYTQSLPCSEDVVQESFLRVWKNAGSWREVKGTAKSWLYKIVYNLTMDYLRKQQLERRHREDVMDDEPVDNGLEKNMVESENRQHLHQALLDLPERQRTALTLFLVNGLSGVEVARVLDLNIEASDSLLARARRNLKSKVQEKGQPIYDKSRTD